MKPKLFPLPILLFALLTFSPFSIAGQNLITFDDLPTGLKTITNSGTIVTFLPSILLTNGYQGLNWSNLFAVNGPLEPGNGKRNGYSYGTVTASNVAFNADGAPAEIDSADVNFNFLSVYLTGAWNSNLNVEVEGFRSGALVYDKIVVASATNATLFTFDYLDIDRLYFNSYGGEDAGFGGFGPIFAADNLSFEFIPEPSSLLLTAIGVVALFASCKRKRR